MKSFCECWICHSRRDAPVSYTVSRYATFWNMHLSVWAAQSSNEEKNWVNFWEWFFQLNVDKRFFFKYCTQKLHMYTPLFLSKKATALVLVWTLWVSRVLKYPKKCLEDLKTCFMSTWWGDSKNMEEIEFSWWFFEGRLRQCKNVLTDGLNWLCYFAGSSKSHR